MTAQPAGRNEAQAKLWAMIKDIKVAMMTSWDGEAMHARPMHGYQEEFEGKLYFFTRLHTGKTDEIARFDKINLAYADIDKNTYVSISGRGRITDDRERMRKYWSPMAAAWFPKGLDDPELRLIEVDADSAQYWDSTSSSMRYLWEIAAANLTGKEPDLGENAKLELHGRR
jgi:general stress protein 26